MCLFDLPPLTLSTWQLRRERRHISKNGTFWNMLNIIKRVKQLQIIDHFNNLLSIHQSFSKQYCMILNLSFLLLNFFITLQKMTREFRFNIWWFFFLLLIQSNSSSCEKLKSFALLFDDYIFLLMAPKYTWCSLFIWKSNFNVKIFF